MEKGIFAMLIFVALAGAALPVPAQATPPRLRAGWHGRIHVFHRRNIHVWRGGHWYHGRHRGRIGRWWDVSGIWYWYPEPAYPYSDPYTSPVVVQTVPSVRPQPQTPMWYYCGDPAGYYPYVPECPSGWKPVPAIPPSGPAPSAPAP